MAVIPREHPLMVEFKQLGSAIALLKRRVPTDEDLAQIAAHPLLQVDAETLAQARVAFQSRATEALILAHLSGDPLPDGISSLAVQLLQEVDFCAAKLAALSQQIRAEQAAAAAAKNNAESVKLYADMTDAELATRSDTLRTTLRASKDALLLVVLEQRKRNRKAKVVAKLDKFSPAERAELLQLVKVDGVLPPPSFGQ